MDSAVEVSVTNDESETSINTNSHTLDNAESTPASTDPQSHTLTPNTADSQSICIEEGKVLKNAIKPRKQRKRKAKTSNDVVLLDESFSDSDSVTSASSSVANVSVRKNRIKMRKGRTSKKDSKSKRQNLDKTDSDESSSGSASDSQSESSTTTKSSEDATKSRKIASRKQKRRLNQKAKRENNADRDANSSDSDDDDVSAEGDERSESSQRPKRKIQKKAPTSVPLGSNPGVASQWKILHSTGTKLKKKLGLTTEVLKSKDPDPEKLGSAAKKSKTAKPGSRMDFVRVDRRWENYNWVTRLTGEDGDVLEYDEYAFKVRREFDYEGKEEEVLLDIKSKSLKQALIKIMGHVKCITLTGDSPSIPPNMIFCFYEDILAYIKTLKKKQKSRQKKRLVKRAKAQMNALKVLVKFIKKDYKDTMKKLYPMIREGKITFPLLWALFKPNTIIYAPTYGSETVPRAFKVDSSYRMKSIVKGDYWLVEGQYLDYDGTTFGLATIETPIEYFKGPKKITTLPCYPLKYNPSAEKLQESLIRRGKTFVQLKGMRFKHHCGMGFYKKPRQTVKLNVDGRVMVDPRNFRRINPNYTVSSIKMEDPDLLSDSESEMDSDEEISLQESAGGSVGGESGNNQFHQFEIKKEDLPKIRKKVVRSQRDKHSTMIVPVVVEEKGNEPMKAEDGAFDDERFTAEDYLIASPVVLGFSFSHKMWVEFDVAGLGDIKFAEEAFNSLVLPDDQKQVVRALVESHSSKDGKNIDDFIQGKGQGLVTVLHGPPGCGKTLTAESIAELLKKPLYMVSVGELGTSGAELERNFSQIIDIAHCWGAILLLDEADIFLEKRSLYDISRNALVSVFLRLLEYFQGIVFLTTNRVVTFDEAFQSRIHVGLRYGELSLKARKEVWRLFLDRLRKIDGVEVHDISDQDYVKLGQYDLNGREIKNSVRTAQSLAAVDKKPLSMDHLLRVLFVGNVFARDLKGPGYEEAMKLYM